MRARSMRNNNQILHSCQTGWRSTTPPVVSKKFGHTNADLWSLYGS